MIVRLRCLDETRSHHAGGRGKGDFPGGQVDLAYEFRLVDGLITHLTIAP